MALANSADPGTIILDGVAFKLAQAKGGGGDLITVSQLSAYEPGVTIGAVDVNSHPVLSTWGISDLTGGHGVADHLAGVTDQRYRFSTADVSRPGKWMPRYAVTQEAGTAAVFWPCGDLLYSGNVEMYGAFGTDLHLWNESTDSWTDTTNNLTATPVNTGVAFKGTGTLKLFIPMGASGYATYTGAVFANVAAGASVPAAKAFCVFGNSSLICLDTSGQLWHSEDGTTWNYTDYGNDGKIDGSLTANWIFESRDALDNPALFVVTSGGVFVFDPAGPTMYQLDLSFPNHPTQGLTGCRWRAENFFAVGLGVHSYTNGNIGAMGLDRDEGLPFGFGYNAKITSLVSEYNDLYALVQGNSTNSLSSVQRWSGYGWHSIWEDDGLNGSIGESRLYVSGARSQHRLWWGGQGNYSLTVDLPIAFTNPRQAYANSVASLDTNEVYLETGFTNMGMPGSKKIAHSVALMLDQFSGSDVYTITPAVYYRLREGGSYTALVGPKDVDGTALTLDSGDRGTAIFYWFDSSFTGVSFDEIELKITWGLPWLVKWAAMYFSKVISGNRAWIATLDLMAGHEVKTPAALDDKLDALVTSGKVYPYIYRDTSYNVRVASWSGEDSTGRADERGMRTVQLIEVHDRP